MINEHPNNHYVVTKLMALVGACIVSGAGALVFNAFPVFLSATADQFSLNDAQLGMLGTSYLGGFSVTALFAPLWMPRVSWHAACLLAYTLITASIFGLWFSHSVNFFIRKWRC